MLASHNILMREALALWAMLRGTGYTAEQLFISMNPKTKDINLVIRCGEKEAAVRIGRTNLTSEEVKASWERIAAEWISGVITDEEMTNFVRTSIARTQITMILTNATALGVVP